MNDAQSQKVTGKTIALVIIVAIVTAVAITLVQQLVLGRSVVAVTGGMVGGSSRHGSRQNEKK